MTPEVVVGVDAGGSGSRAVVVRGGTVVERRDLGPLNVLLHADAVDRLAAVIAGTGARAAGLGLAGLRSAEDGDRIAAELRDRTGARVAVGDDTDAALAGAFAGAPGIVVIAGTGSGAAGRALPLRAPTPTSGPADRPGHATGGTGDTGDRPGGPADRPSGPGDRAGGPADRPSSPADRPGSTGGGSGTGGGTTVRVGGHGFLLGDEGGGYWIGRQAVSAALRAADGTGPPTALDALVRNAFGSLVGAEQQVHRHPTDRQLLARLVPAVALAAGEGDAVAAGILTAAADHLADLADAVQARLGLLPVAGVGGIFRCGPVHAAFTARTAARAPLEPPELGALRLLDR